MPKKESTLVKALLLALYGAGGILSMVMVSPYERGKRLRKKFLYGMSGKSLRDTIYHLRDRGVVEILSKNGEHFLRLTQKGQLETLLAKAKVDNKGKWDGKWRVLIFDIPEDAKLERDRFRNLLKRNNFKKLQASIYVHPYPLNREAIAYLREMGLMKYIRILKVEEMDNDADLRKKFNL